MTLPEYIKVAKAELDEFQKRYEKGNAEEPVNWPMEMDEGEWGEQELAGRFG